MRKVTLREFTDSMNKVNAADMGSDFETLAEHIITFGDKGSWGSIEVCPVTIVQSRNRVTLYHLTTSSHTEISSDLEGLTKKLYDFMKDEIEMPPSVEDIVDKAIREFWASIHAQIDLPHGDIAASDVYNLETIATEVVHNVINNNKDVE